MTHLDDVMGEMHRFPLDDRLIDSFLEGRLGSDEVPPGLQSLNVLLQRAAAPTGAPLWGEKAIVSSFVETIRAAPGISLDPTRRKPMLARLVSMKAAAAFAAVMVGGGAAAAATGSLPVSLQSVAAHSLSQVGVSIPDPGLTAKQGTSQTSTTSGVVPVATTTTSAGGSTIPVYPGSPANLPGLCTAYGSFTAANGDHSADPQLNSTSMSRLTAEAAAKNETVSQFCAGVLSGSSMPTVTTQSSETTQPPESTKTTETTQANDNGSGGSVAPGHDKANLGSGRSSVTSTSPTTNPDTTTSSTTAPRGDN